MQNQMPQLSTLPITSILHWQWKTCSQSISKPLQAACVSFVFINQWCLHMQSGRTKLSEKFYFRIWCF